MSPPSGTCGNPPRSRGKALPATPKVEAHHIGDKATAAKLIARMVWCEFRKVPWFRVCVDVMPGALFGGNRDDRIPEVRRTLQSEPTHAT
jgi:hypothetical protein